MYSVPKKYFAASHENARFGMPASGAKFEDFPGTGMMPMKKVLNGIPFIWSRPHWLGGGRAAIQWHKEMGTRLANANTDEWSITYEPMTGLPVTGDLQYQCNVVYMPTTMKIREGNSTSPVAWDFTNLTLSHGYFAGETVDFGKLGKYRNCGGTGDAEGCPILLPYWIMKLEIQFTPYILEKIKRFAGLLGTLRMLKTMMRFWAYGGITGILCVGGCLAYHYFGSGKR